MYVDTKDLWFSTKAMKFLILFATPTHLFEFGFVSLVLFAKSRNWLGIKDDTRTASSETVSDFKE